MSFFALTQPELEALLLSFKVAVLAVVFGLPVGILCAWVLARCKFPGKSLFDGLLHLPLVVPPVVTGYVLLVMFGRRGVIGCILYVQLGITLAFNWTGAVLAAAVMGFPLMVRAIRLSMEAIDSGLENAARTLGASPLSVFFTITLPLAFPGILTGAVFGFARSLGEFGATITFVSNIPGQTQTLPLALYSLTQTPGGETGALKLCFIAVGLSILALVSSELLSNYTAKRIKG
jgi:molybdate transport system permease protein